MFVGKWEGFGSQDISGREDDELSLLHGTRGESGMLNKRVCRVREGFVFDEDCDVSARDCRHANGRTGPGWYVICPVRIARTDMEGRMVYQTEDSPSWCPYVVEHVVSQDVEPRA